MLRLQITSPSSLTDAVVDLLADDDRVTALSVVRDAALRPRGDLVLADVPREAANQILYGLFDLQVQREGTLHIDQVPTWVSRPAYEAERLAPGSPSDAVVWPQVIQRAYDDSELNWTFITFLSLATVIAVIAIVLDSDILVVGAMILGPEFGAIAALGVAIVRRRLGLLRFATRTLLLGFVVAIAFALLFALLARGLGWIDLDQVSGNRQRTSFIYHPDRWTLVIAVVAGAAGVLSLTSSKVGGLTGVFVSVTTVPAAGNIALALAFGVWDELRGSAVQLVANVAGMAVAGWATLVLQHLIWSHVDIRSARERDPTPPAPPAL